MVGAGDVLRLAPGEWMGGRHRIWLRVEQVRLDVTHADNRRAVLVRGHQVESDGTPICHRNVFVLVHVLERDPRADG